MLGAGQERIGVAVQEWDIERADGADLAGLGRQARFGAGEEGRLIFAEHRAEDVGLQRLRAAVDEQELRLGIGLGDLGQHVVELEADRDDDARLLGRRLEILADRGRIGALIGLGRAA